MNETLRVYSRTRANQLEKLTGVRIIASVIVKRPGQKPLFIRDVVAPINR